MVPAAGGEPRRLTYHPADSGVVGWTPDGKQIAVQFGARGLCQGVVQLFTVPVEGGFATQVPLARASEGVFLSRRRAHRLCAEHPMATRLEALSWRANDSPSGSRILPIPASKPRFLGTIPTTSIPCGSARQSISSPTATAR